MSKKKWRCRFRGCKGTVLRQEKVKVHYSKVGKISGIVSICRCDHCGRKFAVVETGAQKDSISVEYAEAMLED